MKPSVFPLLLIFVEFLESKPPGLPTFLVSLVKGLSMSGSDDIPFPDEFLTSVSRYAHIAQPLMKHQLIERDEFVSQAREVTTADGYILSLTRILPGDDHDGNAGRRPPILMVHGVQAASDTWVLRGKHDDLAFILTNSGFDVWLADMRGNCYSRKHQTLSDADPKFWNFTFHEHGLYDLPALVDYVLESTGFEKIGYIGHSMGTSGFLVFTSLLPDYNRKISSSVLLAPVGPKFPFEEFTNPVVRLILTHRDMLYEALTSSGIYELHPRTARMVNLFFDYCTGPPTQDYCMDAVGLAVGENRENLDRANFAAQMAHFPAGSSTKTMHHLGQVFISGFNQYDYGQEKNQAIYNSSKPPPYPIHLITAPTFMFHGANDPWTSPKVVKYLAQTIPGVKLAKLVPDPKFTHFDFVIGKNTNKTVYQEVLKIMNKYRG